MSTSLRSAQDSFAASGRVMDLLLAGRDDEAADVLVGFNDRDAFCAVCRWAMDVLYARGVQRAGAASRWAFALTEGDWTPETENLGRAFASMLVALANEDDVAAFYVWQPLSPAERLELVVYAATFCRSALRGEPGVFSVGDSGEL